MKPHSTTCSRAERIARAESEIFDIAIIGGGIHGAAAAREAVLRGYKVLLLEARDYSYGTSSRSSKLLHGGVRYLEQLEFALLYESLHERARCVWQAPHLAQAIKKIFPIIKGKTRPYWQVRFGLWFYDLLARFLGPENADAFPWSTPLRRSDTAWRELQELGLEFSEAIQYYDGQMDDTRLVIENIVDASELGAVTLNYARLNKCKRTPGGPAHWSLEWDDEIAQVQRNSQAQFLINTSGPWVPELQQTAFEEPYSHWRKSWPKPVFSRGSHLLFDVPWHREGLILPTDTKGRVYFVLPFFAARGAATLVGTTDVQVPGNEEDPQATEEETSELLGLLARDLPDAGLTKESLYASFGGMRILASYEGNSKRNAVSAVSREEAFLEQDYCVALLGGKYTSARMTAEKLVEVAQDSLQLESKKQKSHVFSRARRLPGGVAYSERGKLELLTDLSEGLDVEEQGELRRAFQRFGMRLPTVFSDGVPASVPELLLRQAQYCVKYEQAVKVEDVIERRLGLERLANSDLPGLRKLFSKISGLAE